jgi:hypothetical protein
VIIYNGPMWHLVGTRIGWATGALIGVVLCAACGGDSKGAAAGPFAAGSATLGADAGGGSAQRSRYCQRDSERRATCAQPFDESACEKRSACYDQHFRAEAQAPAAACLATVACDSNDDDCADRIGRMYAGGAAFKSFAAACMTRVPLCLPNRDPADTAVFCGTNLAALTDADLIDFQRCLELPCEAVEACLDQKWKQLEGC